MTGVALVRLVVVGAVVLVLTTGCAESIKLLPAEGTVTYQGKPLDGALVTFLGEGGKLGTGSTDAAGKYTISTDGQPGAIPGTHQVAISKQSSAAPENPKAEDMKKMMMGGGMKTKDMVPAKYAVPAQSGLTADVQTGKSQFDFTLE